MVEEITPRVAKARYIRGRTLGFRNAQADDASFILSLRTDIKKARFVSRTSPEMSKQIAWLEAYLRSDDQAYFIIEGVMRNPLGTVRLYDSQGDSFCWGSWIMKHSAPQSAAIESALVVYAYALDHLGFRQAHFDVRKDNKSVWQFHERFGAERVGETEVDFLYRIAEAAIASSRQRYKRYLPEPIVVERLQ